MTDSTSDPEPTACEQCILGRRAFLRLTGAALAAALAADSIPLETAEAMAAGARPVVAGRHARTGELRYPLPTADGVQFDKENQVILVRNAGHIYAFNLSCPHQHTALRWVDDGGGRFQCPKHKSRYQPDGTFISGRATRSMDRMPIRLDGGDIVVNPDVLWRADRNPEEWKAAQVTL
ncbi:MAG: Rieske (2Fe-2S) protein [Gemmatimonadales bacterium]